MFLKLVDVCVTVTILLNVHPLYVQGICTEGAVRLASGTTFAEGRVEFCSNRQWGTVCNDGWDDYDALVVCKQLGLYGGLAVKPSVFGAGTGRTLLDEVRCFGNESSLSQCRHNGIGNEDCSHFQDVGVRCLSERQCNDSDVRLANGSSSVEGRVEFCHYGIWGTVCDHLWNTTDSLVVCKQLGLPTEYVYYEVFFDRGSGHIFLDDVQCTGNENSLSQCQHSGIGRHNCNHFGDVATLCLTGPICSDGDVRLVSGTLPSFGRVQVCYRENWKNVCSDKWGDNDATVVCRQLGFSNRDADGWSHSLRMSSILNRVDCNGSEKRLVDCPHPGFQTRSCSRGAVATCRDFLSCNETGAIRLTNSALNRSGRVEMCYDGHWSTVCVDRIITIDKPAIARVVCRQLGYATYGASMLYVDSIETNFTLLPTLLDNVKCVGTENTLFNCSHSGIFTHNCNNRKDMVVYCSRRKCNETDVRLVGNRNSHEGRVEVCEGGVWSRVCGTAWGQNDATVVCRQLGYNGPSSALQISKSGSLIIFSNVKCSGNENLLSECSHITIRQYFCRKEAAVICQNSTTSSSSANSDTSGAVAGSVVAVLVLVAAGVTVVIVAAVIMWWKKKKRMKIYKNSVLSIPMPAVEGTDVNEAVQENEQMEMAPVAPNPYVNNTGHQPHSNSHLGVPSNGDRARLNSSYMRELTRHMIVELRRLSLQESVGQGEFGIVYKATLAPKTGNSTNETVVAVKTLKGYYNPNEIDNMMQESLKMKRFNHRHVMGLIGVCLDAGPAPYIVMPYMANGSVLSYLKKERRGLVLKEGADEQEVDEVCKRLTVMCCQIADGMEYLAKANFVHRDLAARNCMIDSSFLIKITDFGLCEDIYVRNYFRQGHVGGAVKLPVKWMAPESLSDGHFSEKSDAWSFGVTLWEIFSGGKTPYPGTDPLTLIQLLEAGQRMNKPNNTACTQEMYSMMTSCWQYEARQRPSFNQLHRSLYRCCERMAAGYLQMNFNPFLAAERRGPPDENEEEGPDPGITIQVFPPSYKLQPSGLGFRGAGANARY